jgi:hypothetical protein
MNSVQQNVIRDSVNFLNLAAELANVFRAYNVMFFSGDTFYRYQATVADDGFEVMLDSNRKNIFS